MSVVKINGVYFVDAKERLEAFLEDKTIRAAVGNQRLSFCMFDGIVQVSEAPFRNEVKE